MKPNKSFRIDPILLARAKELGLSTTEIFEAALAKVLKDKKCPYCGNKIIK